MSKTAVKTNEIDETVADIMRVPVTRFMSGHIDNYKHWLFPKLRSMFPDMHDRVLLGWLRIAAENNEINSAKAPRAVGMAQVSKEPLNPIPQVREIFVFTEDASDASLIDGAAIYNHFSQWAASMSAREIALGKFTDVPREYIDAATGGAVQDRTVSVIRIA